MVARVLLRLAAAGSFAMLTVGVGLVSVPAALIVAGAAGLAVTGVRLGAVR